FERDVHHARTLAEHAAHRRQYQRRREAQRGAQQLSVEDRCHFPPSRKAYRTGFPVQLYLLTATGVSCTPFNLGNQGELVTNQSNRHAGKRMARTPTESE